jgi:gas vesicle protein
MARYEDAGERMMWFVTGALFGAGIALLYAPASGEDTRRHLRKHAKRSREAIADRGQEFMDRGRDLYERGRKMADEAADMFEQGKKLVGG